MALDRHQRDHPRELFLCHSIEGDDPLNNKLVPLHPSHAQVGIKGLLVAAMVSAAMSTFDSTVNAGAAFWVKDIFQVCWWFCVSLCNPHLPLGGSALLDSRFMCITIPLLFPFSLLFFNSFPCSCRPTSTRRPPRES